MVRNISISIQDKEWITIAEAQKRTGLSHATMHRYLNSGLPFKTIGRNKFVQERSVLEMKTQKGKR